VYFVIRSNIDLGSSMKVGSVTLLRSAPGRNCEMMWESTTGTDAHQYLHCTGQFIDRVQLTIALLRLHDYNYIRHRTEDSLVSSLTCFIVAFCISAVPRFFCSMQQRQRMHLDLVYCLRALSQTSNKGQDSLPMDMRR